MDKIYDEYYYKLYFWAIKKTNNKEDAEDLVNNVFLSIFEYLNKNVKVEKLENLIWKVAYNLWCTKAKKYIKEKRNVIYEDIYNKSYETDMIDKIIYKEIITNLDNFGLTEKEKISFNLYYFNDLSIKEISKKINANETNIKYYLFNARKKIKERYYE
ncbi:MAG: sigma-70 family RNA polymerase sigma factor [Bacilli bacterium]